MPAEGATSQALAAAVPAGRSNRRGSRRAFRRAARPARAIARAGYSTRERRASCPRKDDAGERWLFASAHHRDGGGQCVGCYFDTIPHEPLLAWVKTKVVDGRILDLVAAYLKQGVLEEGKGWSPTELGTPQGAVVSPLLANLYLNAMDWKLRLDGWELVRYADDFVVLCRTREHAEEVLVTVQQWTASAGLQLHPQKTRLVDMSQPGGFDFLGYHFERDGKRWPREKSLNGIQQKLHGLTHRNCGVGLRELIANELNPVLRGW